MTPLSKPCVGWPALRVEFMPVWIVEGWVRLRIRNPAPGLGVLNEASAVGRTFDEAAHNLLQVVNDRG